MQNTSGWVVALKRISPTQNFSSFQFSVAFIVSISLLLSAIYIVGLYCLHGCWGSVRPSGCHWDVVGRLYNSRLIMPP